MVPNVLQFVGAGCLVLFLFAVWPPLALAGFGAIMFLVGLALEVGSK